MCNDGRVELKDPEPESTGTSLPVRRDLALAYLSSFAVAFLMMGASVAGILYPSRLYPKKDLLESSLPNDVVNLLIGLPMLLGSSWLARRGRLIGLLFWPGALFYVFYNYLIYAFGLPLNTGFVISLLLVVLSAYTMIGLVANIDGEAVRKQLAGAVPERLAGAELALQVGDLAMTPAWMIGGVLLWRREPLGYVSGVGLLFLTSMLFVGVIVVLLLQPLLFGVSLRLTDVVVLFAMGSISFVPFSLFLPGVLSRE
jgi:hypothetical protein